MLRLSIEILLCTVHRVLSIIFFFCEATTLFRLYFLFRVIARFYFLLGEVSVLLSTCGGIVRIRWKEIWKSRNLDLERQQIWNGWPANRSRFFAKSQKVGLEKIWPR